MTKIQSINPNQFYIAQNAEVSLKLAGNTAQVTFTAGKNKKCPIKNLSKDEFVNLSTGEVKKRRHSENSFQSPKSVRKSINSLMDLIRCNATNPSNCKWITLTYREESIINYDTENGTISFLETYADKSTSKVYAVTDHYSVYMVASTYDFLRVSDISRKKSLEESGENGSETKQYGQIINRGYYFIEPNKQVVKHPFWIVERQDEFFIIEDNTDSIPLLLIGNLDRIIDLLPTITRYTRKTYREKLYNDESVPYLPHYAYWADMRGGVEGIAVESSNFSDNEQYYARLSNGNIVLLDKDPNFGDKTVDSDSDGICDIDELGVKTKIPVYDPASNKNLLLEAWTFKSNPVAKDTDGDGILDHYDVEPLIYNYVVVEEDDDHITFNTGNVWYKVKMIPIQYRKAFYVESNFDLAELAGEVPNYRDEIQKIAENEKTDFSTTELSIAYILGLDIKYINGSRISKFTTNKLQHEFSHASDFGIEGNWNSAKGIEYQNAIQNNINNATDIYILKYRGTDVYVYYNSNTGLGSYVDYLGNYVGGWKFSSNQLNYHITNGLKIYLESCCLWEVILI